MNASPNTSTSPRIAPAPFAAGVSRRAAWRGLAGALALAGGAAGGRRVVAAAQESTPTAPPLFEAWLAVWGSDPEGAGDLYAADAVLEDVTFGALFLGEEIKTHVEDEFAGFPDHAYELLAAVVAGDRAAAELRFTATYTGSYPGLPPGTGQTVSLRVAVFIELADGKIVREAHYYDAYGFLIQLGVLPAPGTPTA